MVKEIKILFVVLVLTFVLGLVCADTTNIIVKTDKGYNYKVLLGVFNSQGDTIDIQEGHINSTTGETAFTFNSSSQRITFSTAVNFGLYLKVKGEGSYPYYSTGTTITLKALEVPIVANTTNSTSSTTNTTINASASITANLINDTNETANNKTSWNFSGKASKIWYSVDMYVYYILGAIVTLIIIGLIIIGIKKFISTKLPSYLHNKNSSSEDVRVHNNPKIERELEEAQKKIKEAQETINKITHREDKISEAEKKFEEAKKELERAKRGS